MNFEEWWKTQEEPENLLSVSIKDYAKEAWDYQQAIIDGQKKPRVFGTGKVCPKCQDESMLSLTSLNLRVCGCGYKENFYLKPNQKSVLIEGLVGE